MLANVGHGSVQFPAQAVVEGQIGSDLPAVLSEQIQPRTAHVLHLGRSLAVRAGQSQQVVGKCCIAKRAIGRGFVNKEFAVDVEIESLVEALAADVAAEFQRVFSHNLADIVGPLERIAYLRH